MILVDKNTEWSCYEPKEKYSKGHLVFYFRNKNDLISRRTTINYASRYGKAMVDMGFAKDYYMYTIIESVHVTFRYDDDDSISMYGFMNFIKEKNV